jgi:hypothetical protein
VGTVTGSAPPPPPPPAISSPATTVTNTVNKTTGAVTTTTGSLPKTGSSTVTNTTSPASSTKGGGGPTTSSPSSTLNATIESLTGSTGSRSAGGSAGSGASPYGYTGPGTRASGPGSTGGGTLVGGGTLGGASGGPGVVYTSQAPAVRSILDFLAKGDHIRGAGGAAALVQLEAALSQLQGCFYGLSGRERRVLSMRAGLGGRGAHSRSYVAHRLNTTPGKVRQIEQHALFTLDGLAETTGCASGPGAAAAVADGYISPAELAQAPQLVALANPAYQGAGNSEFSRLGTPLDLPPGLPLSRFGEDAKGGGLWALQLLIVMLGLGVLGIARGGPTLAAWVRLKREGLPARAVSARRPEPAPRPVHHHAPAQGPKREGARPARRQIPS